MRTRVRIRQSEERPTAYHFEISVDDGETWIDVPVGKVDVHFDPQSGVVTADARFFDVAVIAPHHRLTQRRRPETPSPMKPQP